MMEDAIEKIDNDDFWNAEYLQSIDIDELLDSRDDSNFDDEWVRVNEEIKNSSIETNIIDTINKVREKVFMKIYDFTEDSDVAAEVSDDFGLICRAYAINFEDKWLSGLVEAYLEKRIPGGIIDNGLDTFRNNFEKLFK